MAFFLWQTNRNGPSYGIYTSLLCQPMLWRRTVGSIDVNYFFKPANPNGVSLGNNSSFSCVEHQQQKKKEEEDGEQKNGKHKEEKRPCLDFQCEYGFPRYVLYLLLFSAHGEGMACLWCCPNNFEAVFNYAALGFLSNNVEIARRGGGIREWTLYWSNPPCDSHRNFIRRNLTSFYLVPYSHMKHTIASWPACTRVNATSQHLNADEHRQDDASNNVLNRPQGSSLRESTFQAFGLGRINVLST